MEVRHRGAEVNVDARLEVARHLEPRRRGKRRGREELANATHDRRVAADDVDGTRRDQLAEGTVPRQALAEPDQRPERRRRSATRGATASVNGSST